LRGIPGLEKNAMGKTRFNFEKQSPVLQGLEVSLPPPLQRGRKGDFERRRIENCSSLWEREAGRDFQKGLFKQHIDPILENGEIEDGGRAKNE